MARMMMFLTVLVVMAAFYAGWSEAYSSGAPSSACKTLFPLHGFPKQNSTGPYSIVLSKTLLKPQEVIDVTLNGGLFRGFIIQPNASSGIFLTENGHKFLSCGSVNNTVTHSINNDDSQVTFQWRAPNTIGDFIFNATVVEIKERIYVNVVTPFSIQ